MYLVCIYTLCQYFIAWTLFGNLASKTYPKHQENMKKQTSDSLEQHVGDSLDLFLHFSTKFILVSLGNLKHLVTLFLKKPLFTLFFPVGKNLFSRFKRGSISPSLSGFYSTRHPSVCAGDPCPHSTGVPLSIFGKFVAKKLWLFGNLFSDREKKWVSGSKSTQKPTVCDFWMDYMEVLVTAPYSGDTVIVDRVIHSES